MMSKKNYKMNQMSSRGKIIFAVSIVVTIYAIITQRTAEPTIWLSVSVIGIALFYLRRKEFPKSVSQKDRDSDNFIFGFNLAEFLFLSLVHIVLMCFHMILFFHTSINYHYLNVAIWILYWIALWSNPKFLKH